MDELRRRLRAVVGPEHVLVDGSLVEPFMVDWTGRFRGSAVAVVRPATTDQVAEVVALCRDHGVAMVPQGGNTGLVGGGVPRSAAERCIVLSTRRLASLGPVDERARQVSAGAGATIGDLRRHVRQETGGRLEYGVDLASRDSATVGGTIATNAGGLHVVSAGDTRAQVMGLEAVLADGSVIRRMSGLVKESAGYDLTGLLVGSEGTLGVVTEARLCVRPPAPTTVTTLVGVQSVADALALLPRAGLQVAEVMTARGMRLVQSVTGLATPLAQDWPVVLLLETDELPELPDGVDASVDRRLREYRERHTEAIATRGVAHKLDVAVPLARLAEFADRLDGAVAAAAPGAAYETYVFGHLATGNLHVNVVGPAPDDEAVDDAVLRLAAELGGTIAAEHGIGVAKTRWLGLTRSEAEIAAMRSIRRALDPAGIMNPGVLVAASGGS